MIYDKYKDTYREYTVCPEKLFDVLGDVYNIIDRIRDVEGCFDTEYPQLLKICNNKVPDKYRYLRDTRKKLLDIKRDIEFLLEGKEVF